MKIHLALLSCTVFIAALANSLPAEAQAIEVDFFTWSDYSSCSPTGDSRDRDCSWSISKTEADNVRSSSVAVLAQASADQLCYVVGCRDAASALLRLRSRFVLEVRRAVTVTPSISTEGGYTIAVPRPTIKLLLEVKGQIVQSGYFDTADVSYNGVALEVADFLEAGSSLDMIVGDPRPYDWMVYPDPYVFQVFHEMEKGYDIPEGASIGEIDDAIDIPFDEFKTWTDSSPPHIDYQAFVKNGGFWQVDYGYFNISTNMIAASDDDEERIICFGLNSGLSNFAEDKWCAPGDRGAGIRLTATVANYLPPHVFEVIGKSPPEPEPEAEPAPIPTMNKWTGLTLILIIGLLGGWNIQRASSRDVCRL